MSNLTRFLKENKKVKENVKYIVSNAFTDEDGKLIEWEIKPITTAENERIREGSMKEVKVRQGNIKTELDTNTYILKLIAASIVFPNLNSTELQDSYEVMSPEELILAMVDDPGDYDRLGRFILDLNGFNRSIDDDIEEAKN